MLNILRENKRSFFVKLVLVIVGMGMVGYLGNYFFGDGSTVTTQGWVARVNGTEIADWQYRDEARRRDESYRQMLGTNYAQFRNQLGIREQALEALISREVMLQDARRLGLRSAPEEVADEIRRFPSFQDANGQFVGAERYRQMVQRGVPGGIAAFEQGLADQLVAEKWINLVTQPVSVGEDEVRERFRKENDKTAIDYVLVASVEPAAGASVPDDELRRAYDADPDRYRRGEGRLIHYVVLDRDAQRSAVEVGPDEVRKYYEENQPRYAHPEQRRASQILVRVPPGSSEEEKARARRTIDGLLARAEAGEDFAVLARSGSQDPETAAVGGDLGWSGKGETLATIDQAIWSTPVGRLAPVIEGPIGGYLLIKVTAERPAGTTPVEEVEDQIRATLVLQAAGARVEAEATRLRAEIAEASRLEEVAQQKGLTVQTHFAASGSPLREIGASPEFAAAVTRLEPGQLSAPLPIASGVAIVTAEAVQPPQVAPFEEVRDRVLKDVLDERANAAALASARAALMEHQDLAKAAKTLDLAVQSADLASGQSLPGSGGTTPEMLRQLFSDSTAVGARGVFQVPAGAVLYQVTRRDPFDEARFQAEKAQLLATALEQERSRYAELVLDRLRQAQKIEVNQARVDAIGPRG